MLIDYHEKRMGREPERKPIQKNRPRKEPMGRLALMSLAALTITFGAGVGTGWLLFKGPKKVAAPAAVAQVARKEEPAPAPAQPNASGEAPLTFYKTLPAGGRATMGTGLNLKKPEPPHAAQKPVSPADPASAPAVPAAASASSAPAASTVPAAPTAGAGNEPKQEEATRYLVQLASYRDKKEADAAQAKLSGKGVAAYVVESKLAEKGVWYRIRVGRHLTKAEAEALAGKYGKGTMVIPE
jgi:cell division septation protein DedD